MRKKVDTIDSSIKLAFLKRYSKEELYEVAIYIMKKIRRMLEERVFMNKYP